MLIELKIPVMTVGSYTQNGEWCFGKEYFGDTIHQLKCTVLSLGVDIVDLKWS